MDRMTYNRAKWHCRRGVRELDVLLERYLEQCYPDASAKELDQFHQLLRCEDSVLQGYFFGGSPPTSNDRRALVDKISALR